MMDERTQGALLLAVGGVALRLGLTDAALAYVKAGLQPLLTAAGVVLVVLGVTAVRRALRTGAEHESLATLTVGVPVAGGPAQRALLTATGHAHAAPGHAHAPKIAWLLLAPLLALLLIAPPALGSFAADRQSVRPPTTVETEFDELPAATGGAVELGLGEYVVRALYDEEASLEGRRVRLSGFVTPAEERDGYLLTRFLMSCCAADAQAIHVEVRGDEQPRAGDTWLEVEGTWQPREGHEPGEPSLEPPLLVVDDVTTTEAPAQPYEY